MKGMKKAMIRFMTIFAGISILLVYFQPIVYAQSILAEQQQLQRQVDTLREEVEELKAVVGALRRAIMRHHAEKTETRSASMTGTSGTSIGTPSAAVDEGALKAQACKDVGQFFDQIDRALKMTDREAAEGAMRKAVGQLNNALDNYRTYPQVRHILTLAEGLAWDTYTAVANRYGTVGNADFVKAIEEYRTRYKKACATSGN
jgi:hypothetical protein